MQIIILKSSCEHVKELSCYNYNVYRLPFSVDSCSLVLESYDGGDNFNGYSLCEINEHNELVSVKYLNVEQDDTAFKINSDCLSYKNSFT